MGLSGSDAVAALPWVSASAQSKGRLEGGPGVRARRLTLLSCALPAGSTTIQPM